MAENASDIILEFDRENGGAHKLRPVYHKGALRIPADWRPFFLAWSGMTSAASHGHTEFAAFMADTWPEWWANLPGEPDGQMPERKSACNQVREITFLTPLP